MGAGGITYSATGPGSGFVEGQITPIAPAAMFYPPNVVARNTGVGAIGTTLPSAIGPGGSAGLVGSKGTLPAADGAAGASGGQTFFGIPAELVWIVALGALAYVALAYIHFHGEVGVAG